MEHLNTQLPPLDINNFDFNAPLSAESYGFFPELDQPLFSANPIDWSHYHGLDFNNNSNEANSNFAISNYSQAPSFSGFDFSSMGGPQPALTATSTSGEQSEVEDALWMGGPTRPQQIQKYGSDYNSDMGEDFFRFTMAQNYSNMSQTQNRPLHSGSNTHSGIDLDQLLKDESQTYAFNTGIPITYAEPEKYIPETYAAYAIPADEPLESSWYGFMPQNDHTGSDRIPHDNTWL